MTVTPVKSPAQGLLASGQAREDRVLDAAGKAEGFERAQLRQVAEDFESIFLNLMLKSMRSTVVKSGLIDGGNAEEIYRSMLDDEYAKIMAGQRHTGIADQIEDFLLRSQGDSAAAQAMAEKAQGIKVYRSQGLQEGRENARITGEAAQAAPVPEVIPPGAAQLAGSRLIRE